jgi:nicotinate-nucleotide pyrophosphorylase (carboxylating)
MFELPAEYVQKIVETALAEDLGKGDVTTDLLVPREIQGKAFVLIKEAGISAGADVAARTFKSVDPGLKVQILIEDGAKVKDGDVIMQISGSVGSILKAERVALNFLQRLSGIASITAQYMEAVHGLGVDIADTRKTTPGLRLLEKYAVKTGGGRNHRMDLSEAILIKDNHFAALKAVGMNYKDVVVKAVNAAPSGMTVEAEATTVAEAVEAAEAGADVIMLDNMPIEEMQKAVDEIEGRAEVEGSGGITLKTVRAAAETGVDFISIGALTHSNKALDISLEYEQPLAR